MTEPTRLQVFGTGFADGEILELHARGDILRINFCNWREEIFTVEFSGVYTFQYFMVVGDLDQATQETNIAFLSEVKRLAQQNGESQDAIERMKCFVFHAASEEFPALQVVATEFKVIQTGENL